MSELVVLLNAVSLDGCGGFGKALVTDCSEVSRVGGRKIKRDFELV